VECNLQKTISILHILTLKGRHQQVPSEHSGCTFFHLLGQIPACESIQLYGGVSQTTEEAISGYQSTLLEQNNGFKPVSASAVQIHYTGSILISSDN